MNKPSDQSVSGSLTVRELSKKTWSDFEAVLGTNGGARGCWCMHWRLSTQEFMERRGEGNKQEMRRLAQRKQPPGCRRRLKNDPLRARES